MFQSALTLYSIGIAAENLSINPKSPEDSTLKIKGAYKPNYALQVTLTEALPYSHGEVNSINKTQKVNTKDSNNKSLNAEIKIGSSIKAMWLQREPNRVTAPNMRRGERVLIWRLGQSDKYYWEPYAADNHLRKLETVIWLFSATQKENEELDISNCYMLEVNTHSKRVRLQTSKSNGEAFEYIINLDTQEGKFTLTDNVNNRIQLDSSQDRITLSNKVGSFFNMKGTEITMNADTSITMKTNTFRVIAKETIHETTKHKVTGTTDQEGHVTFHDGFSGL